jgi:hypothetical protein
MVMIRFNNAEYLGRCLRKRDHLLTPIALDIVRFNRADASENFVRTFIPQYFGLERLVEVRGRRPRKIFKTQGIWNHLSSIYLNPLIFVSE